MSLANFIIPRFWTHQNASDEPARTLFNYRRAWMWAVVLTAMSSLVPLAMLMVFDYQVASRAVENEVRLRTSRIVSNARRTVSFLLEERISALEFIQRQKSYEELVAPGALARLLVDVKGSHGSVVDLGIINEQGMQVAYAGPYSLEGRNYSHHPWFTQSVSGGSFISNVFLGFRNVPHLVIAVRHDLPGGGFYILRATLDTARFNNLADLELMSGGDSFIIDREGILQTPSRRHGDVLDHINLRVPPFSEHTSVFTEPEQEGGLVIGYAYIPGSPFILMVVKSRDELLKPWYQTRREQFGFFVGSVCIILLVVFLVSTALVNMIYIADQNRAAALHHAEHANKMASIGRLAAGVAHEVNNPLAVIGEKAGLLKDLITYGGDELDVSRLGPLADGILSSVERCGNITKHLLGFARHINLSVERIDIRSVVEEVLSFLHKEAGYRGIAIEVDVAEDVPEFDCDRGKLQQILLNLVNNAFQAVPDNAGKVEISADAPDEDHVRIRVSDNGCGIAEGDRKRIFEPFFSTKHGSGGTGLGLSITYGLVRKLAGEIDVESTEGVGTVFTIILPLTCANKEEDTCEYC